MSHDDLTKKQRQVLVFVKNHIANKGFAPSRREIASHIGAVSSNAAHEHLVQLEKKGYINKGEHGVARSITVTKRED